MVDDEEESDEEEFDREEDNKEEFDKEVTLYSSFLPLILLHLLFNPWSMTFISNPLGPRKVLVSLIN